MVLFGKSFDVSVRSRSFQYDDVSGLIQRLDVKADGEFSVAGEIKIFVLCRLVMHSSRLVARLPTAFLNYSLDIF